MSYILDALRKAEMERELSRVPGIASRQQFAHAAGRFSPRLWLPLTAALAVGVAASWLLLREEAPFQAQAAAVSGAGERAPMAAAAPPPVAPANAAPPAAPPEPLAVLQADEEPMLQAIAPAEAPEPALQVEAAAVVDEPPAPPLNERQAIDDVPAAAEPAQAAAPVKAGSGGVREPADVVAMIAAEAERGFPPVERPAQPARQQRSGPATPPEAGEEEPLPPLLTTLPYRFQSTVPKIVINAQAYAEEAQARFVIINMNKYQEGQSTPEGIVIERIGKEHLILSYQGQPFRMQR